MISKIELTKNAKRLHGIPERTRLAWSERGAQLQEECGLRDSARRRMLTPPHTILRRLHRPLDLRLAFQAELQRAYHSRLPHLG